MASIEELFVFWRTWMNKTRTLTEEDLNEMEDHLNEEIEYLMKEENISEEEAFHQATSNLGKRKEIATALTKIKKENTRKRWFAVVNSTFLLAFLAIVVIFFRTFSFEANRIDKHTPLNYPCNGKIYIQYGNQIHPVFRMLDFHTGIDIKVPEGTDLKATADGTVEGAGYNGGYGYCVIIDHGNHLKTLYAHCSVMLVKLGDKVKRGQVIANAGSTGVATEPHVHYEIIQDGIKIDPEAFNKNLFNSISK